MKKILILILVIISIFIGLSFIYLNKWIIRTPRITAPYEFGFDYDYSNEEFELCYEDSETIYDVATCYNDRNIKIKTEQKFTNVGNIYIILRIDNGNIIEYVISSNQYEIYLGDIGRILNTAVTFSYPDNKIISSNPTINKEYTRVYKEDIYSLKEILNKEREIKVYDSANLSSEQEIKDYDTSIKIPFDDNNCEKILEEATFTNDNSEQVLNELTALGII
ncbi:hypothetical protein RZE82_00410 [Mollicutes bacterium LVI A0039]|nr:hypothetical protein RZE82_00410 [Mollicutes bacterium LVI A0039]